MTATQTLKLYQILQKHFKNDADATLVVSEIEELVEKKVESKKDILATKEDLFVLKQDILTLKVDIEKRFNQMTIWIVSTCIALAGLILALSKMK